MKPQKKSSKQAKSKVNSCQMNLKKSPEQAELGDFTKVDSPG